MILAAIASFAISGLEPIYAAEKPEPQSYDLSADQMYGLSIKAFGILGWNITGFDQVNGVITGITPKSGSTFGDSVNVVITQMSDGKTTVVVSSQTPGQLIAWGKNGRNKKNFYATLDKLAKETPRQVMSPTTPGTSSGSGSYPVSTGSGFFVTAKGHLITNSHVIETAKRIDVQVNNKTYSASVLARDPINDIALLSVNVDSVPIPVIESQLTRIAAEVFTIGFPLPTAQGVAPKFTRGEISSTSGLQDDIRYFQISVPIQPGNSGGPLIDSKGNVIGMTTATIGPAWVLQNAGTIPQNVNFAIKSNYILALIKNAPGVVEQLALPHNEIPNNQEDIAAVALPSVALILCY